MSNPWNGKRIVVTGVCGTVGRELLCQVLQRGPGEVIGLDNNESELFFLAEENRSGVPARFALADIRSKDALVEAFRGVDIVLHAAAFKHVVLCERSPRETIQTNILGTQNVIDAAVAAGVQRVLFTSSDKAVNPTNVMGTSKLMGERLVTAANAHRTVDGPVCVSTRFGNVLGSRGSVIPLFKRQIANGGPVTLTDSGMTRFIMTLQEAVHLVMDSVFLARGGEVFVTKMRAVRIRDLAAIMIDELAPRYGRDASSIEVEVVGVKPGEKMYEELVNDEEVRRTVELDDYFVVVPAFKAIYQDIEYLYPRMLRSRIDRPYNSGLEESMSVNELRDYLQCHQLLDTEESECVS